MPNLWLRFCAQFHNIAVRIFDKQHRRVTNVWGRHELLELDAFGSQLSFRFLKVFDVDSDMGADARQSLCGHVVALTDDMNLRAVALVPNPRNPTNLRS